MNTQKYKHGLWCAIQLTYIKLCVVSQVIRTQQQWDLYPAHDFTAQLYIQ